MALRSDQRLKQADKVFLDRHTLSSASCTQIEAVRVWRCMCVCACVWSGLVAAV